MSKRWGSMSDAEKKAELDALHEKLRSGVSEIHSSDDWRKALDVASRFHNYSFNNTFLILLQNPNATRVAGYSTWQRLHRDLKPGKERGKPILILRPITRRIEIDEEPVIGKETEQSKPRVLYKPTGRFAVAKVWDISQTTGPDLPEVAPTLLKGDAPRALWDALVREAESLGYSVDYGNTGAANGLTVPNAKKIILAERLRPLPAAQLKTLIHEVGHIRFGHVDDMEEYQHHRGRMEVETESFAYLVMSMSGMDSSEYSFPYIASWSWGADPDLLQKTGQTVVKAAQELMQRLQLGLDPVASLEPEMEVEPSTLKPPTLTPKNDSPGLRLF